VTITDTLPAGVTFSSASSGCANAAGTVTCNLASIKAGGSATVTITVTPTSGGAITNTATVAGNEADPSTANNTAVATTTVVASADLSLSKTVSTGKPSVGSPLVYKLTVKNAGPSTAHGVTVVDTLPASVTFGSAPAGCTNSGGTVTCAVGDLASGSSATLTITVTPQAAGSITNSASVSATSPNDPNPRDNSASVTTNVKPGTIMGRMQRLHRLLAKRNLFQH